MNTSEIIEFLRTDEIKALFSEMWIEHLYLVWSYSRGDFTKKSDVDLVYIKNNEVRIGWLHFIKNKTFLEQQLNKKIDLVNIDYIYEDLKPYIEKDKILIY